MTISDLRSAWNNYEEGSSKVNIDISLLKRISLEKTGRLLGHLKRDALAEMLINLIFFFPVLSFTIDHANQTGVLIPGIFLGLMILSLVAWSVYSIIFLSTLDYQAPIAKLQHRIARFNYWNLFRQRQLSYFFLPACWLAMVILFCNGVIGINIYEYPLFLLGNAVACLLIVPPLIWFMKKFPDKKMREALDFLKSIELFEKEE